MPPAPLPRGEDIAGLGRRTTPSHLEQRGHADLSRVPTAARTVTFDGTAQPQTACRFATPAGDPAAIRATW